MKKLKIRWPTHQQWLSILGGAASALVTANQYLPRAEAIVHIPAALAAGIELGGVFAAMLGQSVLPRGIVGDVTPPATPQPPTN